LLYPPGTGPITKQKMAAILLAVPVDESLASLDRMLEINRKAERSRHGDY
jgi:hypothetical protein